MADSTPTLYDSVTSFTGGVNSGYDPDLIGDTQLAWGTNVSLRGGKVKNRPPVKACTDLPAGKIQGAEYFSKDGGSILCSIDGKLYKIFVGSNSYSQVEITPAVRNSRYLEYTDFCETPGYMVIQDGQAKPIVFDGTSSRRADLGEVPIGSVSVFGNARIWVLNKDQVLAGDIYQGGDTHLKFTEINYLAEGGAFQLPGRGTGMVLLPRLDNTTATGDLICFTDSSTTAIRAAIFDRNLWKATAGMQRLLFPAIGATNQKSIAEVNTDLYFRSKDGIRSLRNTYTSLQDAGNTPISQEMIRTISSDSPSWLRSLPGVHFNNRYLVAAGPHVVKHFSDIDGKLGYNIAARAVVSLDFASISSLGRETPMIFEGEWTGLNVVEFVAGTFNKHDRLFALCADEDGVNRLYEVLAEGDLFDIEDDGTNLRIQSAIETKSLDFKSPFAFKQLFSAQLWWSDVVGNVDYTVYYKPDGYSCWTEWESGSVCAKYQQCGAPAECSVLPNYQPGYRPKTIISAPPDDENLYLGQAMKVGTEFQIRVEFTGHAKLDKILVTCKPTSSTDVGEADLLNYGGGEVGPPEV